MSSDLLPTYEMEEGEIVSPVSVDNYNETLMTEIKNLRNEMQQMGDFDLPSMMEGCSDYREKTTAKESSLKVGDITFDEDGFRALWIAFIQQERKIDQLERALNAMSGGDGKANPRITRDEMLQCMKNCMEEFGLSKMYWVFENLTLISIKALICGYLVPKKLRPPVIW